MKNTTRQPLTVKLRVLMEQHNLSVQEVAQMLNKSDATVYSWRTRVEPPTEMIELLELKIEARDS